MGEWESCLLGEEQGVEEVWPCRLGRGQVYKDNMPSWEEIRSIGPSWRCGYCPGEIAKFTGVKTGLLGTGLI